MANAKPTASAVTGNGVEDTSPIPITLSGSDSDGTVASFRLNKLPPNGQLFLDAAMTLPAALSTLYPATGNALTLFFQPDPDFAGSASFQYVGVDDLGASSSKATGTVNVAPVNDAPTAVVVTASGKEDTTFEVKLKATDIDGKVASYVIDTLPANGALFLDKAGTNAVVAGQTIPASAKLYFKPAANFNGTTDFLFSAIDDSGATSAASATATIQVTSVNDAPVANAVTATGATVSTIPVTLTGDDVDGTVTAFTISKLPKGTVGTFYLDPGLTNAVVKGAVLPATGESLTVYFKPAAGFVGTVTFQYLAIDDSGGKSAKTTATINVVLDGTPPAAPVITSYATDNGTADNQTNDTTLVLSGTAEANAVVAISDGATPLGTTLADGSGAWSFATGTLGEATHSFTATATDGAGNTSVASAAFPVIIDLTAPAAPVITSYATDNGTADNQTNDTTLVLSGTAEANAVVTISDGATPLGTALADGSGAWSFPTGTLNEATHSFTATATDGAGNTSVASTAFPVIIDLTAPAAPVITDFDDDTGTADGSTTDTTITLNGTAEANATVLVLEGATLHGTALADGTGAWSFTTGALLEGAHTFTANARDRAGNVSVSSADFIVTIDLTAPAAPVITGYATDNGTADNQTNDTTLVLSGTAEANAVVAISDGATPLGTTLADGSGAWSFATGTLGEATHSFTATATDGAGNTSAASTAFPVIIDLTAPSAPAITSYATDNGTADNQTNDTTLVLSGTAEANAVVAISDGATALGTALADGSGAWSFATGTLNEATHSFTATATDGAGNTSVASTAFPVIIDLTAPAAPVITDFDDDTGTADGSTTDTTITLNGTAEANATVLILEGATLHGTALADGTGAWTFTTGALLEGAHTFTANARDRAGNVSASSADFIVTIDLTAPAAPVITGYATDNGTADNQTNDTTLVLSGTAEANAIVTVSDGATPLGTTLADGSGAWSFATGTLNEATHSFTATATDGAGNTSAASTAFPVIIDLTAPSAPAITSYATDNGTADNQTNDTTLVLSGTAEANAVVAISDGATPLGTALADGSGAWSFATGTLSEATHSFTATATDGAGNTSAASTAFPVIIDLTAPAAPAITSFADDTGTADGSTTDTTITLNGTAEANATVLVLEGATLHGTALADGTGAWTFTTGALLEGAHTFTANARDRAGNVSAHSADFTVTIDLTAPAAPAITGYATDNGTADNQTNDTTLVLSGTAEANAVVEVFDGANSLGTALADGSGAWSFATGTLGEATHSFTATATDGAGNTSAASTAFPVIIDLTAPSAPAITSYATDNGTADNQTNDTTLVLSGTAEANAVVAISDGATPLGTALADGSGAWSFATGTLNEATHSFTATATDGAGNTSVASTAFPVIIDLTAPAAPAITSFADDTGTADGTTTDTTITLNGTAEANATVLILEGATLHGSALADGTGAWSFTTGALAEGGHTFVAAARDRAGNISADSADVVVTIDLTAPAAPAITGYATDNGTADNQTNDTTLVLSGTAEANAVVEVFDGANSLGTALADGSGAWSFATGTLGEATHSFTATATDGAGNTSAASTAFPVIIDLTAPSAPAITSYATDNGTADNQTNDTTLVLSGTAEANAVVTISDGATPLGTALADGSGAWSFPTGTLNEATHSFTATATDGAGNTSAASTAFPVIIDLTTPAAPVITDFDDDTGTADGTTTDTTVTLNGTAEANATVLILEGATLHGTALADGTGAWSFTTGTLLEGGHTFNAFARDRAGNLSAASADVVVTIDLTAPAAPTITGFADDTDPTGDGITSDDTITLSGTAENNAIVEIFDGATALGTVATDGSGAWSFTTIALPEGIHSFTATATDGAGNTSAASGALDVTIEAPSPDIDLATLTAAQGFRIFGADASDSSGFSVASAGDVNGDGFDDLIVGARLGDAAGNGKTNAGESYVVFGQAAGFADIDLAALTAAQGFRIFGADAGDQSGRSVALAGDVNGDGFDDLIVGAPYGAAAGNAKSNAGESYVVFGKASGFADIDLSTLTGSQGFRIFGADAIDWSGRSVASAGDVNGDGFDDLIVGAQGGDAAANGKPYAGESYVVFGKATGLADIDLATLTGSQGFRIFGADADDRSGVSVASAGDVNGDGFDDLIVGAPYGDAAGNGTSSAGESYVIFGHASGFADIDLATLTGSQGFRIFGADAADRSGRSVASVGDVNGDGFDDLIVGAILGDAAGNLKTDAGESYVVFGQASGFVDIDLAALTGSQGFRIFGADAVDLSGYSVASAGDVNGDGFDDVIVGAPYGDAAGNGKNFAGESYVVFGRASGFADIDLAVLTPAQGFRIFGADADDFSGRSVASAGDVNGDGFDDLIVGANFGDAAGNGQLDAGESYVIFGGDFLGGVVFAGTSGNDTLTGTAAAETFVGGQGNDTMTGNGGADAFQGGAGDDVVILGDALPLDLNGGSGIDTVALGALGSSIDLSGSDSSRFVNIEKLDLAGGGANTLVLDMQAVLDMAGSNGNAFDDNTLLIKGDVGDSVSLMDGWSAGATIVDPSGETGSYVVYTNGAARLLIESEVQVYTGTLDLAALTGSQGFRIFGADANDRSGWSVASAGDVNGDGFADLIVGARTGDAAGNGKSDAGESYVVFGKASGFADIDLSTLTAAQGFRIWGADNYDYSGFSVASAGDVNGDGFDDLIVGARNGDALGNGKSYAGESYVVFGKASGFADIDLATLTAAQGFRIFGADAGDFSGLSVASAGDVNGDGFDDLIIGAQGGDAAGNGKPYAGESYVVFGQSSGFADIDLTALTTAQGFRIFGADPSDFSGFSVASAGDVNGDGFADLIVGAVFGDAAGNGKNVAGESYVVFGKATGFADIDLAALTGSQGFRIFGAEANDQAGRSVASAGDVNGDGFDDLIVGAYNGDAAGNGKSNAGESYVIFGEASGLADIDLATLTGSQGFRIFGADATDQSGYSVGSAGDVNGDGFDDLIVGARLGDAAGNGKSGAGESYVVFGQAGLADIDLAALTAAQGFRIFGADAGDLSGVSVASAGDVNGDGFDDLMVGSPTGDAAGNAKSNAGESYVIFGGDFLGSVVFAGTSGADALTGTAAAETFVGGQGNDTMTGNGGADAFQGGAGDDTIAVTDLGFRLVDGGSGTDTLVFNTAGATLDFTTIPSNAVTGIETIDITGTGNNTLTLRAGDVLDLSDTPNADFTAANSHNSLVVLGDLGDTLNLIGFDPDGPGGAFPLLNWVLIASDVHLDGVAGGDYDIYDSQGSTVSASVAVHHDVTVNLQFSTLFV